MMVWKRGQRPSSRTIFPPATNASEVALGLPGRGVGLSVTATKHLCGLCAKPPCTPTVTGTPNHGVHHAAAAGVSAIGAHNSTCCTARGACCALPGQAGAGDHAFCVVPCSLPLQGAGGAMRGWNCSCACTKSVWPRQRGNEPGWGRGAAAPARRRMHWHPPSAACVAPLACRQNAFEDLSKRMAAAGAAAVLTLGGLSGAAVASEFDILAETTGEQGGGLGAPACRPCRACARGRQQLALSDIRASTWTSLMSMRYGGPGLQHHAPPPPPQTLPAPLPLIALPLINPCTAPCSPQAALL